VAEPAVSGRRRGGIALPLATGLAVVAAAVAWLLLSGGGRPTGPVPVVWDKEPCAHCHMLVGQPGLAAQAQGEDGRVWNFDDPGCLLRWLAASKEPLRAVYVHHHSEDRWLAREDVAFVEVGDTPMGYGLGAAPRGAPGSLSWEQAVARVMSTRGGR
jgi:hypothetical protein